MQNGLTVELVTFKLNEGADEATFLQAADAVMAAREWLRDPHFALRAATARCTEAGSVACRATTARATSDTSVSR